MRSKVKYKDSFERDIEIESELDLIEEADLNQETFDKHLILPKVNYGDYHGTKAFKRRCNH